MGWGLGSLWIFTLHKKVPHPYRYMPFGWGLLGLTAAGGVFIPMLWRNGLGWLLWLAGVGALAFWSRALWKTHHKALLLLLLWQGLVVLPWSLGDIASLQVPPYFDVATHYALLENNFAGRPIPGVVFLLKHILQLRTYYHLGFHGVMGWVTWLQGLPSPLGMFVVAAIFPIVTLPHTMYWLAYHVWQRRATAFFVGWASSLAWIMPLYALGWGKFPALFALALAPSVLLLVIQALQAEKVWHFVPWLIIGSVALLWAHTRVGSLTLALAAVFGLWRLAEKKISAGMMRLLIASVALWIAAESAILWHKGMYWRFYYPWAWLVIFLAVGMLLWQGKTKANSSLWAGVAAITLLLTAANIIMPACLRRGPQVWLDRPTFELMAPLPLAWLLGALGEEFLPFMMRNKKRWLQQSSAGMLMVGMVAFSWLHAYRVVPQTVFFQEDDQVAFAFLQRLAPRGVILIHGYDQGHPDDGGGWISPLLGYTTETLAQENWWQADTLKTFCTQYPEVWVYVDFNPSGFLPPPERPYLSLEIFLPTVQVYRVDCTAVTR